MSLQNKKYDFTCEPNSIRIFAEESRHRQRLDVELQINGKTALFGAYHIKDKTLDEAKEKIKTFCEGLQMFTEDEIQDWVEEERIMRALYAHRSLRKVWTKGGGLIWAR